MYKEDLALNNPLGLICHKTKPTNKIEKKLSVIECWKYKMLQFLSNIYKLIKFQH